MSPRPVLVAHGLQVSRVEEPTITGATRSPDWTAKQTVLATAAANYIPILYQHGIDLAHKGLKSGFSKLVFVGSGASYDFAEALLPITRRYCETLEVTVMYSESVRNKTLPRYSDATTIYVFFSRMGSSPDTVAAAKWVSSKTNANTVAFTADKSVPLARACQQVIQVGNYKYASIGSGTFLLLNLQAAFLAGIMFGVEQWPLADEFCDLLTVACAMLPICKENYRDEAYAVAKGMAAIFDRNPEANFYIAGEGHLFSLGRCNALTFGVERIGLHSNGLNMVELPHGHGEMLTQKTVVLALVANKTTRPAMYLAEMIKLSGCHAHYIPIVQLEHFQGDDNLKEYVGGLLQVAMLHNILEFLATLIGKNLWELSYMPNITLPCE